MPYYVGFTVFDNLGI